MRYMWNRRLQGKSTSFFTKESPATNSQKLCSNIKSRPLHINRSSFNGLWKRTWGGVLHGCQAWYFNKIIYTPLYFSNSSHYRLDSLGKTFKFKRFANMRETSSFTLMVQRAKFYIIHFSVSQINNDPHMESGIFREKSVFQEELRTVKNSMYWVSIPSILLS